MNKHLIQYGYAPGNYSIVCMDCGKQADSCDKRAARCLQCAEIVWCEREPAEAVTSLARLRERVGELEDLNFALSRSRSANLQDGKRYRRLRVLGVAPSTWRQTTQGTVLCFTNLDEFVDADIAAGSRGEASPDDTDVVTERERLLQEAVRWCIDHGITRGAPGELQALDDDGYSYDIEPPEHLKEILAPLIAEAISHETKTN